MQFAPRVLAKPETDGMEDQIAVAAKDEGVEPLPEGMQSAGGMPARVKCLHALAAHELAVPGINPFGRETLRAIGPWWERGPCVSKEDQNL